MVCLLRGGCKKKRPGGRSLDVKGRYQELWLTTFLKRQFVSTASVELSKMFEVLCKTPQNSVKTSGQNMVKTIVTPHTGSTLACF